MIPAPQQGRRELQGVPGPQRVDAEEVERPCAHLVTRLNHIGGVERDRKPGQYLGGLGRREHALPSQPVHSAPAFHPAGPPNHHVGIVCRQGFEKRGALLSDEEGNESRGVPKPHLEAARSSSSACNSRPPGSAGLGRAQKFGGNGFRDRRI